MDGKRPLQATVFTKTRDAYARWAALVLSLAFVLALQADPAKGDQLLPGGDAAATAAALAPGVPLDVLIRNDIAYRKSLGFQYDEGYVMSLYAHPELTTGTRDAAALFTPAEAAEERLRRDELTADTEAARAWLEGHMADAIGGTFIDHEAGGKVVVALTRDVDATRVALAAVVGRPERLVVRQAEVTEQALNDAMNNIDWAPIVAKAGGPIYSGGVDVQHGRLLMFAEDPDTANRNNAGASTGVPVWFVAGVPATLNANQNEDPNVPPYRGGHGIKMWRCGNFACDWKNACTMGFAAKMPDGINDGAFTAGHCTDYGGVYYGYVTHNDHYPVYIGKTTGSVVRVGGAVDVYAYSAVAGKTTSPTVFMNWPATLKVFATDVGHEQVGYTRIKNGRKTGYGGGVLQSTNFDPDGPGLYYSGGWRRASYYCEGGDSGGPVWHPLNSYAWAAGLHNFRFDDLAGNWLYCAYQHIVNVMTATGYTLKTTT